MENKLEVVLTQTHRRVVAAVLSAVAVYLPLVWLFDSWIYPIIAVLMAGCVGAAVFCVLYGFVKLWGWAS